MTATTVPARPLLARLNWYWTCQCAGWGLVFVLQVLNRPPVPGYAAPDDLRRYLLVCCWGSVSGFLLSDAWHRILKRRQTAVARTGWGVVLAGVLVLGIVNTVVQLAGYIVIRPFGPVRGVSWLPAALASWWGLHLMWNVFHTAAVSLRRANRLEAETLRLQVGAKDAQLRALQAQVNPHFFFNSMNSVRALVYEDRDAAARMIDELTSVMRHALQAGAHDTVPLADEIDVVRAYLAIEQIRFESRLRAQIDVGPGIDTVRIPPMALQTLVENAVKHGVEARPEGSDIRIHARRADDGAAVIEVANAGAIRALSGSTRTGLANARQRLALALGEGAHLDLCEQDGWVRATMRLPEAT
jgi:two-component sensor histidine kinase